MAYYLNVEDFQLNNNTLTNNISGVSLIMFYTQSCPHSNAFMPQYQSLQGSIVGINFGLCCLDGKNHQLSKMSLSSSTPIKGVPKFILYTDGTPFAEYTGQRNRQAILKFLNDIVVQLKQKQSFTKPQRSRQEPLVTPGRIAPPNARGAAPTPGQGATTQYKITPSTGVKEYETSYGLPYNAGNEANFLEYENAYFNKDGSKKR